MSVHLADEDSLAEHTLSDGTVRFNVSLESTKFAPIYPSGLSICLKIHVDYYQGCSI